MAVIVTLSGQQVDVPDADIFLVAGPYPDDVGPHTYVYGQGLGALITSEAPQLLVGRLQTRADFAVLMRPNGTPVWIHAPDVTAVRTPLWTEAPYSGQRIVNAVAAVGRFHQAVQETVSIAIEILNSHNGRL
ncbi:MAG: hypothetical protein JO223_01460 [Hyphomicrobiales bacterium]|nr:hypothetical protein [Hyphomicrobiales bacterium]MBV8443904.1 hypothetical protein [Hyphomicrobiales bacterium]